jgi:hypothetical protein
VLIIASHKALHYFDLLPFLNPKHFALLSSKFIFSLSLFQKQRCIYQSYIIIWQPFRRFSSGILSNKSEAWCFTFSPKSKPFPFLVQIVLQLQDLQIVALELKGM